MYCQNCGTLNNDDAVFCENCGSKLEKDNENTVEVEVPVEQPQQEQQPQQPQQNEIYGNNMKSVSLSKKTIILIAEIILLVIVGYAISSFGKKSFDAQQTAVNYFVDMANRDWKQAYKKLDVQESEFINSKMFVEANKGTTLGTVNSYTINNAGLGSLTNQGNSMGRTVEINYRVKGSSDDRLYRVVLDKQVSKKYFLFENWKVNTENLICKNYILYVPEGAKAIVDGVTLSDKYITEAVEYSEEGMTCYMIPEIFYGSHKLSVTMEDREDFEGTIQLTSESSAYYVREMPWKEEAVKKIVKKAGEDMQKIYAAALEGKDFKSIKDLFTKEENYLNTIEESYERLVKGLHSEHYTITEIRFSNMKGDVYSTGTSVNVSFNYGINYTYVGTSSIENRRYDNGSDKLKFDFVKEDDEWVLTDLGCTELYYY